MKYFSIFVRSNIWPPDQYIYIYFFLLKFAWNNINFIFVRDSIIRNYVSIYSIFIFHIFKNWFNNSRAQHFLHTSLIIRDGIFNVMESRSRRISFNSTNTQISNRSGEILIRYLPSSPCSSNQIDLIYFMQRGYTFFRSTTVNSNLQIQN